MALVTAACGTGLVMASARRPNFSQAPTPRACPVILETHRASRSFRERGQAFKCSAEGSNGSKGKTMFDNKFVADGGGYDGKCDLEDVKAAIKECEGLTGAALEVRNATESSCALLTC